MLHTALAAAAALVALAFALSTFERWLARRRPHELAWSAALAMFSLASGALGAGAAMGWHGPTFRVFYLFGAIVNVPFLALGTVYLLGGRRLGNACALALCLFGAFSAGVLSVAPFTAPLPEDELARGSEVFGPLPRVLAASASTLGTLVLVAGAVWTAARVRRPRVVTANALIAVGTLVTGASGLLNSVLDDMTGFAVALAVGITVIFVGFLVATSAPAPAPPATAAGLSSASCEEELHEGSAEDQRQQHSDGDGGAGSHDGASSSTASPGRSRSSSDADRRSKASETSP